MRGFLGVGHAFRPARLPWRLAHPESTGSVVRHPMAFLMARQAVEDMVTRNEDSPPRPVGTDGRGGRNVLATSCQCQSASAPYFAPALRSIRRRRMNSASIRARRTRHPRPRHSAIGASASWLWTAAVGFARRSARPCSACVLRGGNNGLLGHAFLRGGLRLVSAQRFFRSGLQRRNAQLRLRPLPATPQVLRQPQLSANAIMQPSRPLPAF